MRIVKSFTAAAMALLWAASLLSAQQPEKIEKTIEGSIETRKETQEKAQKWHSDKESLKTRYHQVKEEAENAELNAKRLKGLVERQEAYLSRNKKKLLEMEKIRQGLIPFLEEVVSRLEAHTNKDLPFLTEERTSRIRNLKEVLYDPEVTLADKFRRVFEALQVEMNYGKTVEVTQEEINFKEQKLLVNVLRVGRTALIMQTIDEKEIALYSDGWNALPDTYKKEIKKAIDIAQRRRPVEFVNLPVKVIAK